VRKARHSVGERGGVCRIGNTCPPRRRLLLVRKISVPVVPVVHGVVPALELGELGLPAGELSGRSSADRVKGLAGRCYRVAGPPGGPGGDGPALGVVRDCHICTSVQSLRIRAPSGLCIRARSPPCARLAGVAEIEQATAVFALLADPTRARILHALSLVPRLCVCDVAASLGMSESAVSHQLRLLRTSRLVSRTREGRIAYYSLADEHVRHVLSDALQHAAEDRTSSAGVPA